MSRILIALNARSAVLKKRGWEPLAYYRAKTPKRAGLWNAPAHAAARDGRVRPPGVLWRGQTDIDGVAQVVYAG